jgi:hypothetical protein
MQDRLASLKMDVVLQIKGYYWSMMPFVVSRNVSVEPSISMLGHDSICVLLVLALM